MIKQENPNFVASFYAPNPMEVTYWIDLSTDANGNVIKSYTGNDWLPVNYFTNTIVVLRREEFIRHYMMYKAH